MLKKVFLNRPDIGEARFFSVTVLAKTEEQALRRYIRHCKISRDIKYLGDIVLLPEGKAYNNVFEYEEELYSLFKIKRPYQTEFQMIIMNIIIFQLSGDSEPIIEKRSKCPYEIIDPFETSKESSIFYFPTIEMAKKKLKELEEKLKESNRQDKTICHNIPD